MDVIPAIDVLGDEAVCLRSGDFAQVELRAGSALDVARRFAAARPHLLHVVDLDAAREGRIRPELVERIAAAVDLVPIQAAGGVRSLADANALLEAGADRVVVGTAAFRPGALEELAEALGDRLVVAVDVRGERIAVNGWTRTLPTSPEQAADLCAAAGVVRILCTAVPRGGTLSGPDLALLSRMQRWPELRIVAAGGIASTADLRRVEGTGVEAVVVGRALLDETVPLSAIRS